MYGMIQFDEGGRTMMDFTDLDEADLVVVNTCGFLDSARDESLQAIGEALNENGKVIVTGCLGAEASVITDRHPGVLAVTGPHQYEQVMDADARKRRSNLAGQISLFDPAGPASDEAPDDSSYPELEEYPFRARLAMEKEVSGWPAGSI